MNQHLVFNENIKSFDLNNLFFKNVKFFLAFFRLILKSFWYFLMLVNKIKITFIVIVFKNKSQLEIILSQKKITGDYCDNLIRLIRIVTKAPMINEGLMDDDAEISRTRRLHCFCRRSQT